MNNSPEKWTRLLKIATTAGSAAALFAESQNEIEQEGVLSEDRRVADCKYFLPLTHNTRALIMDGGQGMLPTSLAESCRSVVVADGCGDKIRFLSIRKRDQQQKGLHLVQVGSSPQLPFTAECFDLVWLADPHLSSDDPYFTGLLATCRRVLTHNGLLVLNVSNRLSPLSFLRFGRRETRASARTLFGYRRALKELGFAMTGNYARLPRAGGIPLFFVPVHDSAGMRFFFDRLFPLFDAVSQEVRHRYRLELALAKGLARLAVTCRLTWAAKWFAPGFMIVAQKGASSADAA